MKGGGGGGGGGFISLNINHRCGKQKIMHDTLNFEAFTEVKIQVQVFWVVTSFSVVVGYQRFGAPCCLHLHYATRHHNPKNLDLVNARLVGSFVERENLKDRSVIK
jgi:hypothetical protein